MKEVAKRGFLKTFQSFSALGFGQGLVFQCSSAGKNLGCQRLSDDDPSVTKPVSSMIHQQTEEVEIDTCQKHTRNYSIASDDSITSMCSFQSFSDSIESLHSSTGGNERNEDPEPATAGMSKFVTVECPPGGENSVVFYTTSLELRNELWKVMGERHIPPCLFIKGRYIGGADEVIALHEQGKFHKLLNGITQIDEQLDQPCQNCFNIGFVLCSVCNGSCKVLVIDEHQDPLFARCSYCWSKRVLR